MAIAVTFLERWGGAPRNSVCLIDRHGRIAFTYAKVHTCDFDWEAACTPGDDFLVADLDTAAGEVKVGAMICYDREFPESARILMLKGVEIHPDPERLRDGREPDRAVPGAGLREHGRRGPGQLRRAPGERALRGLDAVAYEEEDGPPADPLIIEAGQDEGTVTGRIPIGRAGPPPFGSG